MRTCFLPKKHKQHLSPSGAISFLTVTIKQVEDKPKESVLVRAVSQNMIMLAAWLRTLEYLSVGQSVSAKQG